MIFLCGTSGTEEGEGGEKEKERRAKGKTIGKGKREGGGEGGREGTTWAAEGGRKNHQCSGVPFDLIAVYYSLYTVHINPLRTAQGPKDMFLAPPIQKRHPTLCFMFKLSIGSLLKTFQLK